MLYRIHPLERATDARGGYRDQKDADRRVSFTSETRDGEVAMIDRSEKGRRPEKRTWLR